MVMYNVFFKWYGCFFLKFLLIRKLSGNFLILIIKVLFLSYCVGKIGLKMMKALLVMSWWILLIMSFFLFWRNLIVILACKLKLYVLFLKIFIIIWRMVFFFGRWLMKLIRLILIVVKIVIFLMICMRLFLKNCNWLVFLGNIICFGLLFNLWLIFLIFNWVKLCLILFVVLVVFLCVLLIILISRLISLVNVKFYNRLYVE